MNIIFKSIMLYLLAILFVFCKNNTVSTQATSTNTADANISNATTINTLPPGKAHINLKVTGIGNGTVQLVGIYADQNFLADTTKMDQNGNARFVKTTVYTPGIYYVVLPNQQNFQLILDKDQEFDIITNAGDPSGAMQVKGSVDNELLYETIKMQLPQDRELQALQAKAQGKPETDPDAIAYKTKNDEVKTARKKWLADCAAKYPDAFFVKFRKAGQNPDVKDIRLPNGKPDANAQAFHFRQDYWNEVDFSDNRLLCSPVMSNKLKQYISDLTPQHQDSLVKNIDFLLSKSLANPELFKYFANWLLFKYEPGKTTLMDGEAVFSFIVKKYFNEKNVTWLKPGDLRAIQTRANEMAGSILNVKGQDVIAKDPSGATKSIYELKTPYVVVYLYHTDCEHCQELTPVLSKLYPQLKQRGVEVFTIAVNTTDAAWKEFIPKYKMTQFINVFDPTNAAVYGKYFVDNTPEIYVLNKERKIIGKNLKPDQINTIIDMDQGKK